jgi:hypothetical protein
MSLLRTRVPSTGLLSPPPPASNVRLGSFDTELTTNSWFDETLYTEGWYVDDLIPPAVVISGQIWIKVGGVWKLTTPWIKVGGVWKQVSRVWFKDNGTWK